MLLLLLCSQGIHMNTLKTKLVECGKPGLSGATVRIKLEAKIRDGGKTFHVVFKHLSSSVVDPGLPDLYIIMQKM
jgi:hypothetical protein